MKRVSEVIKAASMTAERSASVAALAPAHPQSASPLDLPVEAFRAGLDRRKANRAALMEWIRSALVEGVDYGVIVTKRGPSKPCLRKPGAEKICGMLGVTVHFPTLHEYEQAALRGDEIKTIILRCEIRDAAGRVVADGAGARILAQDGGDLNKAIKMAEKSAHIDATLRMAGLSEVFTQDLEDMAETAQLTNKISASQYVELLASIQDYGLDHKRVQAWVMKKYGAQGLDQLTVEQANVVMVMLPKWAEQVKAESAS